MKKITTHQLEGVTIGLDLGDRSHQSCVVDGAGEVVERRKVANEREALSALAKRWPEATIVCECGTHSPWVSRHLESEGCKVLVANPRKMRAIYANERKSDHRDAEMLARIGRSDPKLLHPIRHRGEQAQRDLAHIRLRDQLVRERVKLISCVRFTLKSLGYKVSNPSSAAFARHARAELAAECVELVEPLLEVIESLNERIKGFDRAIERLCRERYPEAQRLREIPGVGPITALYFVLCIESTTRIRKTRDVAAYLGLVPRRDQSGDSDRQLPITKCGDRYLRRLLVSCAQYLMGPFGPPCALREHGQRLSESGAANGRKKAAIAVARKLAVLMYSIWRSGRGYEPRPA